MGRLLYGCVTTWVHGVCVARAIWAAHGPAADAITHAAHGRYERAPPRTSHTTSSSVSPSAFSLYTDDRHMGTHDRMRTDAQMAVLCADCALPPDVSDGASAATRPAITTSAPTYCDVR